MASDTNRPARRSPLLGSRFGRDAFREIHLERRASPRPAEVGHAPLLMLSPDELKRRLDQNATLIAAARPHLEWAASTLAAVGAVLYLVDGEGVVLSSAGPSPEILEESGASPGVDWSGRAVGHNAAGNALASDQQVFAVGSSSGTPPWRRYSAVAVPVHSHDGSVVGAIVAASADPTHGKDRLALAAYAALAAERRLREHEGSAAKRGALPGEARRGHDEAGRFSRLLDAAPDATVLVDETGAILYANAQVERLLGYSAEELLGKSVEVLVPESLRGAHTAHRDHFSREPHVREMGAGLELHARRRDGSVIPVEISLSPIRMREGLLVSAAIRDVTARKEALRRLEIQYGVSRTLSETAGIGEAAPRILETVVRGTGWDAGELWIVDPEKKALLASHFWCLPSLELSEFERETRALSLPRGTSMAGRVWETGAPVFVADLSREDNFARFRAALKAGLRSGFGFPLTLGPRVIGVFGFFSRGQIDLDPETERMLTALGSQVGQFIERRRAEEGLQASETKLGLLLRQMPLALWTIDEKLTITYYAGKHFGTGPILPAEAYLGKSLTDIFKAEHSALGAHQGALLGNAGSYELETEGQSFKCAVEPLRDREGRIVGALSVAIDVTDFKKSQALLRESESRLRLMTEQAPVALWTTDRELRLTRAAGSVLESLGVKGADLAGRSIAEVCRVLRIEDAPRDPHALALAGESVDFEFRLGGSTFAGKVDPLFDSRGEIAGIVGVAFDVSKLKQAEQEARRMNAELDRRVRERTAELEEALRDLNAFSYSIAHDLRAPIRAIASGAFIVLEERDRLGEEARAWTDRILQAANQMDTLVSGLLEYSRLRRHDIMLGPVDWEDIVRDTLSQMEGEIAKTRAEVSVERPLPRVRAHALTLTQALANLVSNALKFAPIGVSPKVRIRAERGSPEGMPGSPPAGWVRLWVEDQGIGIAREHQERIFGVFERLHGQESYPGTGIGLAIVLRVVERMGGKAGVESEPNRGSRFFIDLREAGEP